MPKLPGIPHLRAIRAFQRAGFRVVRQRKHFSMTDGERILVIPRANPVNAFTMGGIIKDAGLTNLKASCDLSIENPVKIGFFAYRNSEG